MGKTEKEKSLQKGKTMEVKNEEDVLKIIKSLEEDWCNPFDIEIVPDQLINICTGKVVDKKIEKSLGNFLEAAKERVRNILNNTCEDSFWKPAKRDKILTFKDTKIKPKKTANKTFIGSECMFRRIICTARFQEMDLTNILAHELSLVPGSLFHEDGSMRKTAKSDLAKKLETFTTPIISSPNISSYIIDGMVLIRELKPSLLTTFTELGRLFLGKIITEGRKHRSKRIIVVFDTYNDNSLKNAERSRRGDSNVTEFQVSGSRKVPKFDNFLKSSSNKRSLLIFLTNYFVQNGPSSLGDNEFLIIAGGFENPKHVFLITKNDDPKNIYSLNSNQEEADTRIILHVLAEVDHGNSILVKSVDTDVLLLLLHYYSTAQELSSCQLFIQLGHSKNKRYIAIHDIVEKLGLSICKNLLAIHCLTGCDTTSAFYKIGKKTAFDVLTKNINHLTEIGDIPKLSEDEAVKISTKYVYYLYKNKNKNISTLNEMRVFLTSTTNRPASELPPTDDAFKQHLKRLEFIFFYLFKNARV